MRELVRQILAVAPELDDATAIRIACRLRERERPVSARAVADHLGLRKPDWVYANAERLGGWRLGEGRQPRWRFYLSEVEERLHEMRAWQAPRRIPSPEPKAREARRGERREGFTAGGNKLVDFEAA